MIEHIDPFIGVDGAGNCLPGPCLPLGLVRLGPDVVPPHSTNGYASDRPILRFSHTHVSGTGGMSRYGNVGFTPFTGTVRLNVDPQFARNERASVGYYAVELGGTGIFVELTATARTGVHRIHFPAPGGHLLVDAGALIQGGYLGPTLDPNGWQARSIGGSIERSGPRALEGRADLIGGWGHGAAYSVYFFAEFDTELTGVEMADGGGFQPGDHVAGPHCRAVLTFRETTVTARVGISFVSIAKARASVAREAGGSFDEIHAAARAAWATAMAPIEVRGGSADDHTLFATSFLRLLTMPSDLGVDDEFPRWHHGVRHFSDFYCLWDSVRNANSLIALVHPETHVDFMNCLLDIGETTGWVPDAWIAGHSAFLQGGSSADILFCETALKGLPGFDARAALEMSRRTAESPSPDPYRFGRFTEGYESLGYVDAGVPQSVSRHLEYAYQDDCIARLAAHVGDEGPAGRSRARAARVWNLWHPEHRSFAPRTWEGEWLPGFDPELTRHDFWNDPWAYEGSCRQWSFCVQHDYAGLVERHGGPGAFRVHLDWFLDEDRPRRSAPHGRARHDRYANKETMLHVPSLYHVVGRPDLSSRAVRRAMDRHFGCRRDGLADNEDMGCQSAFFMTGALGLTPLMGQDRYLLTSPAFEESRIRLGGGGEELRITTRGPVGRGLPIQRASFNGQPLDRAWLHHHELAGGTLELEVGEGDSTWARTPLPDPR